MQYPTSAQWGKDPTSATEAWGSTQWGKYPTSATEAWGSTQWGKDPTSATEAWGSRNPTMPISTHGFANYLNAYAASVLSAVIGRKFAGATGRTTWELWECFSTHPTECSIETP